MVAIYADGASLEQMAKYAKDDRIAGFTTNPSLMKKAGITHYRSFSNAVLQAVGEKPVSFEVLADDFDTMELQAAEIASWGENVWVKIPIVTTDGFYTSELLQRLWRQNIKVNITAVMTQRQLRHLANVHGFGRHPTIVSIFAGRIADTGADPASVIVGALPKWAIQNVKVLWASTRQVADVYEAELLGCDIITLTPDLLAKLDLRGKDLEQYSIETVRMFHTDGQGIVF